MLSEAVCPIFKNKEAPSQHLWSEKIDYLNGGNRPPPGALNYSAGDHRFLLLTRQRRGFGVTAQILFKPRILGTDEFGLLINYFNFFHPNAERAYGVAMHWRQHDFNPWLRCLLYKQSSKENFEFYQGLPLAFLMPLRQHLSSIFPLVKKCRGKRNWVSEIVFIAL